MWFSSRNLQTHEWIMCSMTLLQTNVNEYNFQAGPWAPVYGVENCWRLDSLQEFHQMKDWLKMLKMNARIGDTSLLDSLRIQHQINN